MCNGKDDDCDGVVDNQPAVDQSCAKQKGLPFICLAGQCTSAITWAGQICGDPTDCKSGICVSVADDRSACSLACKQPADCLPGWSCAPLVDHVTSVCQCTSIPEVCDGRDNDCNGVVDDPAPANADCLATHGAGAACAAGHCVCTISQCGSECVDFKSDPLNCGGCGKACAGSAALCQAGACVCPPQFAMCAGACVDPSADLKHCGGCGKACPMAPPPEQAMCVAAQCRTATVLARKIGA